MTMFLFKQASRLLIKEEVVRYGSKRTEIGIIVQVQICALLMEKYFTNCLSCIVRHVFLCAGDGSWASPFTNHL